jgi:hypothetical protein
MPVPDVSEDDARAVLAAVMNAYGLTAEDDYVPIVRVDDEAPEGEPVTYVLLWEDGPHEWPFSEAPTREELPATVWLEPINHYSMRILARP